MKKLILFFAASVILFPASGQTDYKTVIPDIPGYKTLKCDFHIHTVLSDGDVMPSVRVNEAAREGLDAIAITDHIEYRPNHRSGLVSSDFNKSYEMAAQAARLYGIVVIPGAELTRGMPPGHWNALFIEDAGKLETEKWEDAFAEARRQGAFLMWNHPGWFIQQPNETLFLPEHQRLYEQGYMMGIEIANHACGDYYPEAHQWCLDKNITMLGCTDIHDPIGHLVDFSRREHRYMTLVFAKEKSAESIKEALMNGMTAVYAEDNIYGREEFLKPLFESMLDVKVVSVSKNSVVFELTNKSSVVLHIDKGDGGRDLVYPRQSKIRPFESVHAVVRTVGGVPFDSDGITVSLLIKNFHTGVGMGMAYDMQVPLK